MKIVHYSTSLSRSAGGLHHSVSGLAKAQAALGADVIVAGGADGFFATDKSIWSDLPLVTHNLRNRYGLSLSLATAIRRLKPDILHIHGIWSAGSLYGATLPARARVVSPRGMLDPWILRRKPLVKTIHAALFERPMLRRAHLHALTESERSAALRFMPSLARRCFVLPNGIDAPTGPISEGKSGTLYLGRLHEKKQVLDLIRAWSRLPKDQHLTIAGWGDPAYEHAVAHAAQAANVHFVGPLHGEAKAIAFNASRFFILPSLSEGQPMAVLEALRHGCIPLITDACNLPELFADTVAYRIDPTLLNLPDLMQRLTSLPQQELDDRSRRAAHYAQNYFWPGIATRMLARYDAILSSGNSQP